MRAVFVFCEGSHDVAFIERSLLTHGHGQPYKGKITALPTPLGLPRQPGARQTESLIANHYADRTFANLKITQARHAPPPVFESIIVDDDRDRLYVLLSTGTVPTQNDACLALIRRLHDALDPLTRSEISQGAMAIVTDADESRSAAEVALREYCAPHFGEQQALAHDTWVDTHRGRLGCYIWHDPATQSGTLEGVVRPLLANALGGQWQAAARFVDQNADQWQADSAKRTKATAGVAVQLHKPGAAAGYIYHRDIIDRCAFLSDPRCTALVQFVTRAFAP